MDCFGRANCGSGRRVNVGPFFFFTHNEASLSLIKSTTIVISRKESSFRGHQSDKDTALPVFLKGPFILSLATVYFLI